jgi:hypothetical protein
MGVLYHVCGYVVYLALDDAAEQELARAGAAELLVALLRNKSAPPEVHANACFALANICLATVECKAHAGMLGVVEAIIAVMAKHASHEVLIVGASNALSRLLSGCCENVVKAQRAGGLRLMQAALRAHGSREEVAECASQVVDVLQQHASAATSAADAAMAALLAEEEADRAAKSVKPAARKSKKKRAGAQRAAAEAEEEASGSGIGPPAGAASATGDADAITHDAAAASDSGAASATGDAGASAAAADAAVEAVASIAATVPQPATLPAPADGAAVVDAASSSAADAPPPMQTAPDTDVDATGSSNRGAAGGVGDAVFAAAPTAAAPFTVPSPAASSYAAPPHNLSAAPRLPAPPPYCPPRGAPQLTRCAPPPSAPLSDEAAAAMLPPYLAELRLGAPPTAQPQQLQLHPAQAPPLPPAAAAAPPPAALPPRSPSPPPPPVMKECCVCLLDLPQNELLLLMSAATAACARSARKC